MAFDDDFPDLLEQDYPHLATRGYTLRSPKTVLYNCFAWAAGDGRRWWEPGQDTYWPPGVDTNLTLESLMAAYATLGYRACASASKERGWEKIAIYIDELGPTHAARQRGNGVWTSKLGKDHDIDHQHLEALEGPSYGRVAAYMRRPRSTRKRSRKPSRPRLSPRPRTT